MFFAMYFYRLSLLILFSWIIWPIIAFQVILLLNIILALFWFANALRAVRITLLFILSLLLFKEMVDVVTSLTSWQIGSKFFGQLSSRMVRGVVQEAETLLELNELFTYFGVLKLLAVVDHIVTHHRGRI